MYIVYQKCTCVVKYMGVYNRGGRWRLRIPHIDIRTYCNLVVQRKLNQFQNHDIKIFFSIFFFSSQTKIFFRYLKPLVPFLYTINMMKTYLRKLDIWFFSSPAVGMMFPWVVVFSIIHGVSYIVS